MLTSGGGLIHLPTGVQVKRKKTNVQRPDIDRFIGALSGQYSYGIFLTNSDYAPSAVEKARKAVPVITTINGSQICDLMLAHSLGVIRHETIEGRGEGIDELYFEGMEERATRSRLVRETPETYTPPTPEPPSTEVEPSDDLVSLQALSYLLGVDTTTIRNWVESGKVLPDYRSPTGKGFYFRRDQVDTIRTTMQLSQRPASSDEWRQKFLEFVSSSRLTKSYKPVLIRALLLSVDEEGKASIDKLTLLFRQFYEEREARGLSWNAVVQF